jgi:hypothetical protein
MRTIKVNAIVEFEELHSIPMLVNVLKTVIEKAFFLGSKVILLEVTEDVIPAEGLQETGDVRESDIGTPASLRYNGSNE